MSTAFYILLASITLLVVKKLPANAGDKRDQVRPLGLEDPLEEGMAIHSNILAWESHGQSSLVGYSSWGGKESATTEETLAQHSIVNTFSSENNLKGFHLANQRMQQVGQAFLCLRYLNGEHFF